MRKAAEMKSTKQASRPDDFYIGPTSSGMHLFVSALVASMGLLLVWRALPRPFPVAWSPLQVAGPALGGLVATGGLLALAFRSAKGRVAAAFSRKHPLLGALIATLSAAACVVDILSGRSALVLVCGAVALSLLYWDRPRYLFALLFLDAAAGAAAVLTVGATAAGGAPDWEQLALALSSAGLGAAIGLTIGGIVAPGSERLRSLERENRELRDLSFRDGLTAVYNRRFAQETGQKLFTRAQRYQERFHALMVDIDHFKRVNDKMGHAAGDEVLKGIAAILQSCVRASDVVARYGGEEFVLFLVQAEPETAQFIANRIRDDVASHRFEGVPWQVTISVGVAGMVVGERLEELVDRADKSLYVAKRGGRNRVAGF
jgi:diguanylate cyclase (GGDEF)-like protein